MKKMIFLILLSCFVGGVTAQAQSLKFKRKKRQPNETTGGAVIDLNAIESYFSFIPMGRVTMPDNSTVSCDAFYMLRFEVPNMMYRMFIDDLKNQGKFDLLNQSLPDTASWATITVMKEMYFSHSAYNDYPAMQIPRKGAFLFCEWLNEKIGTLSLKTWKGKKIFFRLPMEAEWMMAARGGNQNSLYAWDGQYLRDSRGLFLADTTPLQEKPEEDGAYFTAPVLSYKPNNYGLYNMTGNVREIVMEEGFTKGGSYADPSGECLVSNRFTVEKENLPGTGFRIIAIVAD